jgi:adenylate cyclase
MESPAPDERMRLTTLGRDRAPEGDRLPARVSETIRRQEERSEILIGWVQFAIVCTFTVLYSAAPQAADSDATMFRPVPLFLAGYFGFTVIRLVLAYRRFMPSWFLYLSIVIDMGLLMGLIWSFHIQYGQPAAFYLKAPTLLYVFIFIALRALRYDARYVIMAGAVAAVFWMALVGYALFEGPAEQITRNYIVYMTGNRILLGAEFDKVISILLVTGILAAALIRARRLLVASVRDSLAAQDLRRFFSPEIARAITDADRAIAAGEGETREAAILMVDIRGFSTYAETRPAAEVIRQLAEYQTFMVPVLRRHGGSVDKFLGDGIMATFGAERRSPTYAADALRALDELVAAAEAWNEARAAEGAGPRLEVNAAVATGRVVFGAVGDADRLEYTVIGGAVNLASKLEKHNKRERVRALATREAYRTALDQGYRPPDDKPHRPARPIEGVAEPVDLVVMAA